MSPPPSMRPRPRWRARRLIPFVVSVLGGNEESLLPSQTTPTIGDRLSD